MRRLRRRGGISTFAAGLIGIVVLVLITYLVFTKFANPFSTRYTVHATFSSANGLRPDSLVRIAGVNVGKVTSISAAPGCKLSRPARSQCAAANVTIEVDKRGLPLHTDATFAIRPRTFLEGNFFVDVSPGTPSAPTAPNGHRFPIQQGVVPVQLDQVLTSLQADTRRNLQILLGQYGSAVKQGGPSYNASIPYWLPAYKYSSIVARNALGIKPHDLSSWVAAQGKVAAALDSNPQNLKSLITDFNTTANAFARQNVALQNAVAELPRTLAAATPALNAVDAALPPVTALARALIPGVESAGPAIDASLPFIIQLRLLVAPSELGGLASDLAVTVPSLARLTRETIPLMRDGVRPASSCLATVVYPWSQLTVNDPHFNASNGFPPRKVYVEAVDYLPGLAGESRNFDANGAYIRVLLTAGSLTYSLSPGAFGQAVAPLIATQPTLPPGGRRPPLEPTVPCETQPPISDLSTPTGPPLTQVK
jgi:phospholipid/cholesterol/gamma-HCH transport system substrate-binding protein